MKNELLAPWPPEKDMFEVNQKNGTTSMAQSIFGIDVNEKNEIVVGHIAGGCVFNPDDGRMIKLVKVYKPLSDGSIRNVNIAGFRIRNGFLINVLVDGRSIYTYKM
ncbi:MAG: hypothetical protein GY765_10070 [bacterium]|nr:hypothetical protein [bacterium]